MSCTTNILLRPLLVFLDTNDYQSQNTIQIETASLALPDDALRDLQIEINFCTKVGQGPEASEKNGYEHYIF